jgi:hypothetical protein
MASRKSVTATGTEELTPAGLPQLVSDASISLFPTPTFAAAGSDTKLKPEALLQTYDGSGSPVRWLASVGELVALGKWSETYTVRLLLTKLMGAARIFMDKAVPVGESLTFDKFGRLLQSRFQPRANLITRLLELRNAQQTRGEPMVEWASRIRLLGYDSCSSTAEVDTLGPRLMAYFLHGLRDKNVRDSVLLQKPQDLEGALTLSLEAEIEHGPARGNKPDLEIGISGLTANEAQRGQRVRPRTGGAAFGRRTAGNKPQGWNQAGIGARNGRGAVVTPTERCDFCKFRGHAAGDCRKRLFEEGRCFKCKKSGHFAEACSSQEASLVEDQCDILVREAAALIPAPGNGERPLVL